MPKQAPSIGRMAALVGFTLSCFALLIFLWLSFGGPIPLRPEQYQVKVEAGEASLVVVEAEVRMAGLRVGRVKAKQLGEGATTELTMEIDPEFAPVPRDSRVTLRQKALLGETYVEITPGSQDSGMLPDGGMLPEAAVEEATQIDEVVRVFDRPTRRAFRGFVEEVAKALDERGGENLNDALGTLPDFVYTGSEVLETLDEQEPALRALIRNTGVALEAVNERRGQLRELVGNANDTFEALASRNESLADIVEILPTFLDESRLTLGRLEEFSRDTRPLVQDLRPVAAELAPTLRDVGRLAPNLESLFRNLRVVIRESEQNLPAAARFLGGAEPVLEALHPYLQELNPILAFANFYQAQLADFITNGSGSLNGTLPGLAGEGPRHFLNQFAMTNARSLGIQTTRPEYDRGNAYPSPNYLRRARQFGSITEAFDCRAARTNDRENPQAGSPPCFVQVPSLFDGRRYPNVDRGRSQLVDPPQGNAP